MTWRRLLITAFFPAGGLLVQHILALQTGALVGTVHRGTDGSVIAGAHVVVRQLRREALTNSRGMFRLDSLPAGRFALSVRALGFAPYHDTVTVAGTETIMRDVVLMSLTQLDSVAVVAPKTEHATVTIRAFEERRRRGVGRFLDQDDLRRDETRTLATALAQRIPGVTAVVTGAGTFLASSRSAADRSGRALGRRVQPGTCWVTVYRDGVLLYDGSQSGVSPLSFDRLKTGDFAAIEFYSEATAPPEFRGASGCGTLVLWSR
jgi:hypothetical protein